MSPSQSNILGLVPLFLLGALALSSPAQGADEDGGVFWTHPWLQTRYFDYHHKRWTPIKEAALPVYFVTSNSRHEARADGTRVDRWEFELRVNNPEWTPEFLHIASLTPHTKTEISRLELRWTSGGRTREFGRGDLLERGDSLFGGYISDRSSLMLPMPGNQPGTLVGTVETTEAPHPGFEAYFGGIEVLPREYPIKERTITLVAPADWTLAWEGRFFTLPSPPQPVVTGGEQTVTLSFETLYRGFSERQMPHLLDTYPSVAWSNQPSWEALGALVQGQWAPHLVAEPSMEAWAREVVDGISEPSERARALHDAVASEWEYLGFYPAESGWVPHDASACFGARIGDCKDRTALLVSLMRSVGLPARPALVNTGDPFALPGVPALLFNHAVVWVDDPDHGSGGFVLDSTDPGIGGMPLGPHLDDRQALLLGDRPALLTIPPSPPEAHRDEDETWVTLRPDGSAELRIERRQHGASAAAEMAARGRTDPQEWQTLLETRLLSAWPGAELVDAERGPDPAAPRDTWLTTATLTLPQALGRQGDHAVFLPGWLDPRDPSSLYVDRGTRTHPVELHGFQRRSILHIGLPPGLSVLAAPVGGGERRDEWSSELSARVEPGEVILELEVRERPGHLDPGLQEARRNFARGVLDLQRQVLVLRGEVEG